MMKDYYSLFVAACTDLCHDSDYSDTAKVRMHNKAMKKINQISDAIMLDDCPDVFIRLMEYPDEMVRMNAAAKCLQFDLFTDKAESVLLSIIDLTKDESILFSCKNVLRNS